MSSSKYHKGLLSKYYNESKINKIRHYACCAGINTNTCADTNPELSFYQFIKLTGMYTCILFEDTTTGEQIIYQL